MTEKRIVKQDELLFVVDQHDRPIEPLPRGFVHNNGIWHRVVHIWIVNRGEILCQQRSLSKDLNPGKWESFFGGHLAPGDNYRDGARREIVEEIGLKIAESDLRHDITFPYTSADGRNREFMGIFSLQWSGDIKTLRFSDAEVEQVAWVPMEEVKTRLETADPAWSSFHGYEITYLGKLGAEAARRS